MALGIRNHHAQVRQVIAFAPGVDSAEQGPAAQEMLNAHFSDGCLPARGKTEN